MSNTRLVWSDKDGDVRKSEKEKDSNPAQDPIAKDMVLKVRRLTAGKGRSVIEISGLPNHKTWCESLAKDLKKSLGVGGTFKEKYIEIHCEQIEKVTKILDSKSLKWKKTGG